MTYGPTVWVDYGVPCVNAANLNNMEAGIDRAQGDIMVLRGATAAIPASDPLLVGRLYFETDLLLRGWRDNGAGWDLVTVPAPYGSLLLKTGQTTQYGGYDDDGFYEWGVAKAYTVLTLGQYAGVTAITLNAKVENHSNNCVQDDETGLMWSRTVSGANVGPANNGLLPWTTNGAGEGIFTYIAAANAVTLAGHADWRVPNLFEAWSLVNSEVPTGMPDGAAFPVWQRLLHTSTTHPQNVAACMRFDYNVGGDLPVGKANTAYVSLVRG